MPAVIDWLLEPEQPAVQYRTMTQLLGLAEDCADAQTVYQTVWQTKAIQKMLQKQGPGGYWEHTEEAYGVHTSLRYLTAFAEHGLHQDQRLDPAADFAIQFLIEKETADLRNDYSGCSNALLLRALVMLGYGQDARVAGLLERLDQTQLEDGGFLCRRLLAKKPASKTCYKAAAASLLLYAECQQRGLRLPGTERLLAYFLERDVFFDRSTKQNLLSDAHPGWRGIDAFFPAESMRVGLPQIMAALAAFGAGKHPALARGWEILDAKRNENGRYVLEGTLTKQPCTFGAVGKENKWVTLYALLANQRRA